MASSLNCSMVNLSNFQQNQSNAAKTLDLSLFELIFMVSQKFFRFKRKIPIKLVGS